MTLGQIAYEASKGLLGGCVLSWECIATEERAFFEAAAQAVAAAVRAEMTSAGEPE
jgi:hypothetical protein